jgi:hypothetical protein
MAKNNKKQLAEPKQNPWILLAMGVIFTVVTYVLGSWAIDSGSLWLYALCFTALYGSLRFYTVLIRNMFLQSDKPTKK